MREGIRFYLFKRAVNQEGEHTWIRRLVNNLEFYDIFMENMFKLAVIYDVDEMHGVQRASSLTRTLSGHLKPATDTQASCKYI